MPVILRRGRSKDSGSMGGWDMGLLYPREADRAVRITSSTHPGALLMAHDLPLTPSRRQLIATLAGLGIGNLTFQRALVAQAPKEKEGRITEEMIKQAE